MQTSRAKDNNDQTALLWAAKNEYSAVVRLLLDREAKIEAKDRDGRTALHWAVEWGREAVARLLLERNVDVEAKDKKRSNTAVIGRDEWV